MGRYYFVVNSFPPLSIGVKPGVSYDEIRELLKLNLNSDDWKQVEVLQRLSDLRNIRAFWLKEPLNHRGNFLEKDLEEALLVRDLLPQFVSDFLDRYENLADRLHYFSALYAAFYQEIGDLSAFLQKIFRFERDVRLVLTALRAKGSGRDLSRELQFEDLADPLVALLLAQKEDAEAVVPQEYEELKTLFLENRAHPRLLQRAILEFRFSRIEDFEAGVEPFGMEQVLGYLIRLAIVEEWESFDEKQGRAALDQMIRS